MHSAGLISLALWYASAFAVTIPASSVHSKSSPAVHKFSSAGYTPSPYGYKPSTSTHSPYSPVHTSSTSTYTPYSARYTPSSSFYKPSTSTYDSYGAAASAVSSALVGPSPSSACYQTKTTEFGNKSLRPGNYTLTKYDVMMDVCDLVGDKGDLFRYTADWKFEFYIPYKAPSAEECTSIIMALLDTCVEDEGRIGGEVTVGGNVYSAWEYSAGAHPSLSPSNPYKPSSIVPTSFLYKASSTISTPYPYKASSTAFTSSLYKPSPTASKPPYTVATAYPGPATLYCSANLSSNAFLQALVNPKYVSVDLDQEYGRATDAVCDPTLTRIPYQSYPWIGKVWELALMGPGEKVASEAVCKEYFANIVNYCMVGLSLNGGSLTINGTIYQLREAPSSNMYVAQ